MNRQLDLFDDGAAQMRRSDLTQALLAADIAAASHAIDALAAAFDGDPMLGPAQVLLEHLHGQQAALAAGRMDAAAIQRASRQLAQVVSAAAPAALGPADAPAWLRQQWLWLAHRAADNAADASPSTAHTAHTAPAHADTDADSHPAALFLRAQAWPQAAQAVAHIPSWRRVPLPLLWMTEARWRHDGADAAWPLLAEALWLAPARAAALLQRLADRSLARLIERFEERFEGSGSGGDPDWRWLPAFALVEQPLLSPALAGASPSADSPPSTALRLVQALLRLERQGRHHDIVRHRAQLQALSAPLLAAYMSTR